MWEESDWKRLCDHLLCKDGSADDLKRADGIAERRCHRAIGIHGQAALVCSSVLNEYVLRSRFTGLWIFKTNLVKFATLCSGGASPQLTHVRSAPPPHDSMRQKLPITVGSGILRSHRVQYIQKGVTMMTTVRILYTLCFCNSCGRRSKNINMNFSKIVYGKIFRLTFTLIF